jgi:hypothetical protein
MCRIRLCLSNTAMSVEFNCLSNPTVSVESNYSLSSGLFLLYRRILNNGLLLNRQSSALQGIYFELETSILIFCLILQSHHFDITDNISYIYLDIGLLET